MRHGFIVQAARVIGTEPAVVEATLAYRAAKGREIDGKMVFSVDIAELEHDYDYFENDIMDALLSVTGITNSDGDMAYEIDVQDFGGIMTATVKADVRWLAYREAL